MTDNEIQAVASHVWTTASQELLRLHEYNDKEVFVRCVRMLALHTGRVVVTGVGTSGVAARKFAHSLSCIEVPAIYLNPADAMHGAMGLVQKGDLVFLISKGGGTKEIMQLIPSLRHKQVSLIAVSENKQSPLVEQTDMFLHVEVQHEADSFNMLATTSILAVIAMFDAICIAVMQLKGYTKEQFAVIHPGGAVGDRLVDLL
jgi:KpsF/GutQ family protein